MTHADGIQSFLAKNREIISPRATSAPFAGCVCVFVRGFWSTDFKIDLIGGGNFETWERSFPRRADVAVGRLSRCQKDAGRKPRI